MVALVTAIRGAAPVVKSMPCRIWFYHNHIVTLSDAKRESVGFYYVEELVYDNEYLHSSWGDGCLTKPSMM